jgi:hypothetical protein
MFMVDQMKPKEKLAQFKVRRGWLWRVALFLTTTQENGNELNSKR